jgi:hypothetical protein
MAQAVDLQLFTLCFVRAQMVWDRSDVNHARSWGRPCIHRGYGFDRQRINSLHFAAMPDLSATWKHGPLIPILHYTCQKHSPTHQVCVVQLVRCTALQLSGPVTHSSQAHQFRRFQGKNSFCGVVKMIPRTPSISSLSECSS